MNKSATQIYSEIKDYYTKIIDSLEDTIFIFDLKTYKAIEWNKAFSSISGYSDKEISSSKFPDNYFGREDQKQIKLATKEIHKSPAKFELSLITNDGTKIPFEYVLVPIVNPEGKILICSIGKDLRECKKSEEALFTLNLILSSLDEGLDIVSSNYIIQFQNKYLKDRFGNAIGKKCYKTYLGLNGPCWDCSMREAIKQNKIAITEKTTTSNRIYEIIAIPFKQSKGKGNVLEVVRDITDRKRIKKRNNKKSS